MRRRRNADAPSSTEAEAAQASEIINPADTNSPAPSFTEPETPAEAAAATDKPKPRRAAAPRRKAQAASPEGEAPPQAPVPEPTPQHEAAPMTSAEKPKRTSSRRRRTPAADEAIVAETAQGEAASAEAPLVETVAPESAAEALPTADTALPDATPETSRSKRGGRRRGGGAKADRSSETAPSSNEPPSVPHTGAEEPAASRPARTRGPQVSRRQPAAGARTVSSPPTAPPLTNEAISPPAPGDSGEGSSPAQRRVRGLRRTTNVPAARTTAPAVEAAVPALVAEKVPASYQPLPDATLARLPETKIVLRDYMPELVINGEAKLPFWFFVNTEASDEQDIIVRQIRLAYEAGIRFFTVLAHLPWKSRSGERRYEPLDTMLQLVADNAPDAFLLPRLIFSPPLSWERNNPDEMTRYGDGEMGDVSLASKAFWESEAEAALRAAVEHTAEGPHAGRVFGFYLEHGEWLYEKGRGYDVSPANTQGFRAWLRSRYKGNAVGLRSSWHDGQVTFETAEIPSFPPPAGATLFLTPRERRWSDFHEYSSDIVAQVITRLGKAVKEASGGRSAVAVSYGYTLEMARAASGHLALGQVLASPHIDILTGPISYSARMPGGSAPLAAPIDSVHLAGKLWVSEDDTKTFLAGEETPDNYNPKIGSLEGTAAAHVRNFGAALAKGAGISWMDLWGEGWLDDRDIWQGIARMTAVAENLKACRRAATQETSAASVPDVAVIVDEKSFFGVRADETLLSHLICNQRDTLLRSGARVGFFLLSDLTNENFPDCKLLLFLNAFQLPETVRSAIRDRFQDDGRTLAWVYGPGVLEDSSESGGTAAAGGVAGASVTELSEVVGIQLRLQPWGSRLGTQVLSNGRSPLTETLKGQKIGEEIRVNPSFFVVDPKAQVLGEYAGTGNPSIALRKHPRWQSVFIGEWSLPLPLLRGLYRIAGVPVYTVDDDVAWISDNLLCLHSAPGGGTTVHLTEEGVLYDLLSGETLAASGFGIRLSMPPRGTRLLFYGPSADVSRLGGDPKAGPPGLTAGEIPARPAAFIFEDKGAASPSSPSRTDISPEDDALFAAALAEEMPVLDKEDGEYIEEEPVETTVRVTDGVAVITEQGSATAEDEAAKKKRRRRRRRGRGKSGGEDDVAAEGGEDTDETGDDDGAEENSDAPPPPGENVPTAISGPEPRTRPSLAELLPLSDAPDDGVELPPIPDEFLPLPTRDTSTQTEGSGDNGDAPGTEGRVRRRRAPRSPRRLAADPEAPQPAEE